MIDGRKDPAKAEQRKEAARKAAETKKRNHASKQNQIPGAFPDEDNVDNADSRTDTPVEDTGGANLPATRTVPTLSFQSIQGGYEGPHALLQPAEIDREPHEPAGTAMVVYRNNEEPEGSQNVRQDDTQTPSMAPSMTRSSHTIHQIEPPTHTIDLQQHRDPGEGASVSSSRRSEEMRRMAETIRQLQDNNRNLQDNNRALQDELATVKSRKSSLASHSVVGSERRLESGHGRSLEVEERADRPMEYRAVEMNMETPLSKKWVDMDEVEVQQVTRQESPRRVLEEVLRNNRRDRLTQAALGSPERIIETSETTAVHRRVSPQIHQPISPSESYQRKFAEMTFTRGNTLKPNQYYDRWSDWANRIERNQNPIVYMARRLPIVL